MQCVYCVITALFALRYANPRVKKNDSVKLKRTFVRYVVILGEGLDGILVVLSAGGGGDADPLEDLGRGEILVGVLGPPDVVVAEGGRRLQVPGPAAPERPGPVLVNRRPDHQEEYRPGHDPANRCY